MSKNAKKNFFNSNKSVTFISKEEEKLQGHSNTFKDRILDGYCEDNIKLIPLKTTRPLEKW